MLALRLRLNPMCVCLQGVHGLAALVLRLGELQCYRPRGLGHRAEGLGRRRAHGESDSAPPRCVLTVM